MSLYGCCVPLPLTPDEIRFQDGVDVFLETIGKITPGQYPQAIIDGLVKQCWLKFAQRPIGDYDYSYWMQSFNNRAVYEWDKYVKVLGLMLDSNLISLKTSRAAVIDTISGFNQNIAVVAGLNTVDGTDTIAATNIHNINSDSTSTVSVEDRPDIAAGTTQYITNKTGTVNASGQTDNADIDSLDTKHSTEEISNTNTVNGSANSDRNMTTDMYDGLTAEQTLKVIDIVDTLSERFVNKLDYLFMNRW